MQFLKSYIPLVDGRDNERRTLHLHPEAMVKTNSDMPIPMNRLIPLLERRAELPIQFEAKLWRAWAITNERNANGDLVDTLLVD